MKTEEKHLFNDERYEKQFCFGLVLLPSSEEVAVEEEVAEDIL